MFRRVANALPAWGWAMLIVLFPLACAAISQWLLLPPDGSALIGTQDPDGWLRLTLVKQWLHGASWYDHSYASNAPNGIAYSPWTRPLDVVIAAISWLQGNGDLSLRLLRTAILLPMLWMGLLLAAIIASVKRITPARTATIMAAVLMLTLPCTHNYFGIGNADHHAPLAALFAWVMGWMLRPTNAIAAIRIGLALALMLWISPEAIIPIAIVLGWYGLLWASGASTAHALARLSATLALAASVALMLERPQAEWLLPVADRLSFTTIAPLWIAAVACQIICLLAPVSRHGRTLLAVLLAAASAGWVWLVAPRFFLGPMADADAFIHETFLPMIAEATPIWRLDLVEASGMLLLPLLALAVAARCVWRSDGVISRQQAACLGWVLLGTLCMFALQARWYYYLFPATIVVLACYIAAWLTPENPQLRSYWPARAIAQLPVAEQVIRRVPLLLLVLVAPLTLFILGQPVPDEVEKAKTTCRLEAMKFIQSGGLATLDGGTPRTILANTNLGGALLFFTPHRIVASNYHREGIAIRDAWKMQTTDDVTVLKTLLRTRKVDMLLVCPNGLTDDGKQPLFDQLWYGTRTIPGIRRLKAPENLSATGPAFFLVKRP